MSAPLKDLLANPRHAIYGQFGKFLLVGLGNVVLTVTLYEGLLYLTHYMTAYLIAFIVGVLYTTVLTIVFTFSKDLSPGNIATQGVWYILYGCIYAACLKLAVGCLGVPPALAPIPLLVVLTPVNFLCARWLTKVVQ